MDLGVLAFGRETVVAHSSVSHAVMDAWHFNDGVVLQLAKVSKF